MPSATSSWLTSLRTGKWPAATNGPASAPRRMGYYTEGLMAVGVLKSAARP
jgi:hypothetical protein